MTKRGKIALAVIAVALLLIVGILVLGAMTLFGGHAYYVQVDNSKMEEIDINGGVINFKGSQPYAYTLTGYDDAGRSAQLRFTADKVLREGAYLRLTRRPIRGVVGWWEVGYEDLPEAVQGKLPKPE